MEKSRGNFAHDHELQERTRSWGGSQVKHRRELVAEGVHGKAALWENKGNQNGTGEHVVLNSPGGYFGP